MPPVILYVAALTVAEIVAYAYVAAMIYIVSKMVAPKPRRPEGMGPRDRQLMIATPDEPRCWVMGRYVKSGVRVWTQVKDGQLYVVVILAAHEVHAIGDIWFGDELVGSLDANGNVTTGRFAGVAQVRKYLGTSSQTADSVLMAAFPTLWTSAHRLLGLAYLVLRFQRADEIYTNGAPTPRAEIFGLKVEDPRDGVIRYTDNAALLLRYYLMEHRGATRAEIDEASFIAAANVCDEWVRVDTNSTPYKPIAVTSVNTATDTLSLSTTTVNETVSPSSLEDGMRLQVTATSFPAELSALTDYYVIVVDKVTIKLALTRQKAITHDAINLSTAGSGLALKLIYQPRYTVNGLFDSEQTPREIVTTLGAAMGNVTGCVPTQGVYKCFPGAYTAPSRTITVSDLRGDISVQTRPPTRSAFNEVHGMFVDPFADWQSRDYPPVKNSTYVTEDYGVVSPTNVDFVYCTNEIRAQRLAKIELERHRQGITVNWPGKISLFGIAPGDRLALTVAQLGWAAKEFRVESWALSADFGVDLALAEEASTIYDWAAGAATVTDAAPDTNFPRPWEIATPTALACASGTAQLLVGGDGTVLSRVLVSWSYATGAHFTGFEVRFKVGTDAAYSYARLPGDTRATYLNAVRDGVSYDIGVRAVGQLATSAWVSVAHVVVGKTAAPSDVTGFTSVFNSTGVLFSWTAIADADADLYEIRFGASYATGATIAQTRSLTYQHGMLAAGTTAAWIKAIDTTGISSATAATRSVVVSAPSTPTVTGSVDAADYVLSWPSVSGTFPVATYEVRYGASYAAGTFVATLSGTSLKRPAAWSGARTFWVAAIDVAGNTGAAASSTLTVSAATAPSVTSSIVGPDALLTWTIPSASLPIEQYEVRYGASFAAGVSLGKVKGTTYRFKAEWLGARTFWVAAIDTAGNTGTAGSATITITAPAAPIVTPRAVQNLFSIVWDQPAASLPIDRYEVRRGATFAGANSLGFLTARTYNGFELVGGSYTYWVVGIDSAGNQGTEGSAAITVASPTGLTVYEAINSTLSGTLSSAIALNGDVVFPVDTAKTWATHYSTQSWNTAQDQITAGYDPYLEPSAASGYYEETIDHGSSIASSNVVVSTTTQTIDGAPAITCLISWKLAGGDAWTDTAAGFSASIASAARYFKVRITCTSTGNDDLASLDVLQIQITS